MAGEIDAWTDALRAGRDQFERTLARVPADQLESPGAAGTWSVKDVLAHLTMRQTRVVTMMFQVERGGKAQLIDAGQKQNEKDFADQKDRALERVLADFRAVHGQLIRRAAAVGAPFFDARKHAALGGRSLAQYVQEQTTAHEEAHRLEIEAWLERAGAGS